MRNPYHFPTNDNQYFYYICKNARLSTDLDGNRFTYYVWSLIENSLPDQKGNYQRGLVIAEFGNTKHKENFKRAKFTAECFVTLRNSHIEL